MDIVSRQTHRAANRLALKARKQSNKEQGFIQARRSLLARQSIREKAGYYEGTRAVAACVSPSRSRTTKRKVKKGEYGGRILKVVTEDGRETQHHATKGLRNYRA